MHIQQQKYAKNMQYKYYCAVCDYGCSRKFLWEQHLGTRKHKSATEATDCQPEDMQNSALHICEYCGREYKQRSGLWRHKKKCQPPKTATVTTTEELVVSDNTNDSDDTDMRLLVKEMMTHMRTQAEQLQAQNKIISDMIPNMGSNNNNRFNINVFLNEQCKDALDMSDFLESLQIQLRDLDYIRDNGLMEGISTVFIKGLNQLDTFKRPIHCTDVKRETLYIKDGGEWDRDTGKERMKTAIDTLANKHRIALADWESKNPNWQQNESKKDEYLLLVQSLMGDIEESNGENKIIKTIAKNTIIDDKVKN
ncbi:MAG: hypothetical protein CMI79_06640 [Candidatus Pelagibacter sp.]|nr:hypothetical protein [Candidatus Pelagibacter sp.]|tara:strand:+ start:550 stop:1476 length:927 start_codon:yes stop_codon:yes gene_type:complete